VPAVALGRARDGRGRGFSSSLGNGRCRLLNSKAVCILMHDGCSVRRRKAMLLGAHAVCSSLTNTKLSCARRSQPIETDRKDRSPCDSIGTGWRILIVCWPTAGKRSNTGPGMPYSGYPGWATKAANENGMG
jgi:hypothetical protein